MSQTRRLLIKEFAPIMGTIICMMALVVLVVWQSHMAYLAKIMPQFITFQYNSALAFVVVGLGLVCSQRLRVLTGIMGVILLIISALVFAEYVLKPQFIMHHVFFSSLTDFASLLKGRILPLPSVSFFCISLSFIFILPIFPNRFRCVFVFLLGLFILAFSVIALFGYIVPVPPNVGWGALTRMAFLEAWLFLIVALAIIVAIWQEAKRFKVDLKTYLPLATIIIGVTFFALMRIVLVSEEYHEVSVTIRLISESYENELGIEMKRYLQSFHRMQARWQYNHAEAQPVERMDIKQFMKDYKAVESIALFDAKGQLRWYAYQANLTTRDYEKFYLQTIGKKLFLQTGSDLGSAVKLHRHFYPARGQLLLVYPLKQGKHVLAYLASIVDLRQLFAIVGHEDERNNYNLAISYQGQEFYRAPLFFNANLEALTREMNLPALAIPLQLKFWPTERLLRSVLSWYPTISFIVGVLVTLLVAFLLKLWQSAERREVARRTSQRMLLKAHNKLKATTQLMIQTEKMSVLGTFAAGTAHELNNPLMGILNYVQYCKKRTKEHDPRYPVLQDAENEVLRCSQIIRNLLMFSRMENEGEEALVPTDIAILIERVLKLLTYRIRKEGVMVATSFADSIELVPMQANKIQQVFVNLLSNAMDALRDKKEKEIRINIEPIDGEAVISISDNGCGIPDAIQRQIFDAFITTKPAGEGTGLGLAVSKHIIDEHQGRITCESVVDLGTKFTLYLPLTTERGLESDQEYLSDR